MPCLIFSLAPWKRSRRCQLWKTDQDAGSEHEVRDEEDNESVNEDEEQAQGEEDAEEEHKEDEDEEEAQMDVDDKAEGDDDDTLAHTTRSSKRKAKMKLTAGRAKRATSRNME